MPKLQNTIQFSLDTEKRELLENFASSGESLGLAAKRIILDVLTGQSSGDEKTSSAIEEKLKTIEERFTIMSNQILELGERVTKLENPEKGDLDVVLDAIRNLGQQFNQGDEIFKLRSQVKMQQDEINDQQDKIDRLTFQLQNAYSKNDEQERLINQLQNELDAKTPDNVDLEENLITDSTEVDPEVDPSQDTTPVNVLEIADQPDQPLEAQNFIESPPEDDNVQNHQQPEEVIAVLYTRDELEAKSRDELKVLATDLGLYVSSKKIKSELIKMILDHQ